MEDKDTSSSSEDYRLKEANLLDLSIDFNLVPPTMACINPDECKTPECDAYRPLKTSISSPENYGYTRPLIAAYKPRDINPLECTITELDNALKSSRKKSAAHPDIISNKGPETAASNEGDGGVPKSIGVFKSSGKCKSGAKEKSRRQRKFEKHQEKQMWKIIRVLFLYLVFLVVQMSITYRIVTPESYLMKENLENVFMNDKATTDMLFTNMRNTEEFWMWARSGFLNGLFVKRDYNSVPSSSLHGYINDGVSLIMGFATLRQQRVRPGLCKTFYKLRSVIEECNGRYSNSMKDKRTYAPGWMPLPDNQTDNSDDDNVKKTPYMYRHAATLDGYTYWGWRHAYGGGGYVLDLSGNRSVLNEQMAALERDGWIDQYTRAVFIEFTVYNPNVNFFCVATILIEFEPTGGTVPSYRFEPAVLLAYGSHTMVYQVVCEIAFFAFTVSFIVVQVRKIFKQRIRYLRSWHYLELLTILCAVISITVYFYKYIETRRLTLQMKKSRGTKYMKFQYVGYWNEFFSYSFGWVVFFGILKFIRLLRFNKRIFMLAGTWRYGAKSIAHFSFIFWVLFLAFAQLFYLTFMSSMYSFHHIIASAESCFTMLMGLFDIYQMTMVSPMLAKCYIFLYVLTIMFVVINMFMSILNETFAYVRLEIENKKNKYEIIDFMVERFKQWGGSGRRTLRRTPTRLNNQIRKFRTSRKRFSTPKKMDRLLNSFHRSRTRSQERRMNKNKEKQVPRLNLEIEDVTEIDKPVNRVEMKSNPDKVVCESPKELHTTKLTVTLHWKPESNILVDKNILGNQPSNKDFSLDEKNIP